MGDVDVCQECGIEFDQSMQGHYIDDIDLGPEPDGATGRLFKRDVEKSGNTWEGFEEDDIGPVCDTCSWKMQRRREKVGDGR